MEKYLSAETEQWQTEREYDLVRILKKNRVLSYSRQCDAEEGG